MKSIITIIVILLVGIGIWSATKDRSVTAPIINNGDSTPLTDGSYTADIASSSVVWEGSKILVPGYTDIGTLKLVSGEFAVASGTIVSGSFIMNMNSITASSTGRGDGQDMLSKHLKSADFFNVAVYPTATFTISSSTVGANGAVTVSGSLQIKDKTNNVTIPATIVQEGSKTMISGETVLDRTLWDVRYGSGKFFQDLGNNIIDDKFKVILNVVASSAI